jgi:hypothetical protein
VTKDVNDTGDRIVLHLNIPKMLLDKESPDYLLLRNMLSIHKVSFEKTMDLLREHHIMFFGEIFNEIILVKDLLALD